MQKYTVSELARLSGVSARTLRYYDGIGLLKPIRQADNGYRRYGSAEVDWLQQILFYRELDVPLADIGRLLDADAGDRAAALKRHLRALETRRARLDTLIATVCTTLAAEKGELTMTDQEKFAGFMHEKVQENENKYGREARSRYGDAAVDAQNDRLCGMSKEQWDNTEQLRVEINHALREAMAEGDPASAAAQRACALHRQWLTVYWGEAAYSKEAHLGIAEMYVSDPRFCSYYDAEAAPGAAAFLLSALRIYCD